MFRICTQLLQEWNNFYSRALAHSDPRVKDWFMMSSMLPNVGIVMGYLIFLYIAPKLMEKRAPFEARWVMSAYNAAMVALNSYIFIELLYCATKAGYNYSCQQVSYSYDPYEHRIAKVLWWFYMSKIIEVLDTVLFVLRKKNNQITFLHVYHHATMIFLWWIGVKWVAGGQSFSSVLINSFVHIIMYSYYGLSAYPSLRKYLWWKRYLTMLQLVQFVTLFFLAFQSLYVKCDFPLWMQYTLCAYMVSFLILFGNFYIHAYNVKQQNKPKREVYQNGSNGALKNGLVGNGEVHYDQSMEKKVQ